MDMIDSTNPDKLEELSIPLEESGYPVCEAGTSIPGPGGRYIVSHLIKKEAWGHVYEARDEQNRSVWLHEGLGEAGSIRLQHDHAVLHDLQEARCPMLPELGEMFEHGGRLWLTSEAVTGPTLAEFLATPESRSLPYRVQLVAQVVSALKSVHGSGWVYLALRPESIVVGKPVKLMDFSRARRIGDGVGSPFSYGYSAPEVALGDRALDVTADVYSVGALLYHLLTGKTVGDTGEYAPPGIGGVPQILSGCLGSNPARRIASMGNLHREVSRLRARLDSPPSITLAGGTNIGLEVGRTTNQDSYTFTSGRRETDEGHLTWAVFSVADGMGGMDAGDLASRIAIYSLSRAAQDVTSHGPWTGQQQVSQVQAWIQAAAERVFTAMEQQRARGGTTMICGFVVNRCLAIAHVGDCRAYLFRRGECRLLTQDHSVVMSLVLLGQLQMEDLRTHEDRSKISRSLGDRPTLPDYWVDTLQTATGAPTLDLEPGDVILLCSDGVWEPVLEEEMLEIVVRNDRNLDQAVADLLARALENGGPDNATAVLLRLDAPQVAECLLRPRVNGGAKSGWSGPVPAPAVQEDARPAESDVDGDDPAPTPEEEVTPAVTPVHEEDLAPAPEEEVTPAVMAVQAEDLAPTPEEDSPAVIPVHAENLAPTPEEEVAPAVTPVHEEDLAPAPEEENAPEVMPVEVGAEPVLCSMDPALPMVPQP